ncbi:hypothetical protein AaE_015517 [Aphanomyces astaci]|uniref:Tc1-like transposase DDE domain-containing protein n=1 Tax=Aphanomyces astaci TaxID=112090 RepID=A0A6A4YWZ7_APHAT|nr:hypothetical protein AaE_015517 [Aphanomyces astaci]
MLRQIFRLATVKHYSSKRIAEALNNTVKASTVRHWLRLTKLAKYIKRKPRPALKKHHKKARAKFAAEWMSKSNLWANVVFSDEKKFNLDGPDGYQYYWHDLRKEQEIYTKRVSGGGSVMIWAGMSAFGRTELAFLEGKQNSTSYCRTLDMYLLPFLGKLRCQHGIIDPIFQQDNASIHVSRFTRAHIEQSGIGLMDWPAKSPDLNPIENAWGQLSWLVYQGGRQFSTVDELKAQIRVSWEQLRGSYLQNLVEGMPTRMAQVVLKNGGAIDN